MLELLASTLQVQALFATEAFLQENKGILLKAAFLTEPATCEELQRLSTLQTNDAALAVVQARPNNALRPAAGEWLLALDDLRDPGNLGTIIRIADWYGLQKIICSESTVELFNPKVIAASMGSFLRVDTFYTDLPAYFRQFPALSVFGTFLDGSAVQAAHFGGAGGCIVIGNESRGISPQVAACVQERLTIPRFGGAESLNAGIATAIVLDNLRRLVS